MTAKPKAPAPAVQRHPSTTQPPSVQHRANTGPSRASPEPAPQVHCGDCAEFEPDSINPPEGVGKCARTMDGFPPVAVRSYGLCTPVTPRYCPDFKPQYEQEKQP